MTPARMPHSIEAEQSTIGAMLFDSSVIARVAELLTVEDFHNERHRRFFVTILDMAKSGLECDTVTFAAELEKRGRMEDGDGAYAADLVYRVPGSANIEAYARIVAEKSEERKLLRGAERVKSIVADTDKTIEQKKNESGQIFFALGERGAQGGFEPIGKLSQDELGRIAFRTDNPGQSVGLSTGFADIDRMVTGHQAGDLIIVAARPAMGKTSLALQYALHCALVERLPTAIFSLEMSKEQITQRILSIMAQITVQDMRLGLSSDEDFERLDYANTKLQNSPLEIDDTPAISTFQMQTRLRSLSARVGQLGLIVVDYLQLAHSAGKAENRVNEVSAIARELKQIAREMRCPLIALSQLSRKVEERENKRPMLSDLRESGSIEAEADLVQFIYRQSYYDRKNTEAQLPQWGPVMEEVDKTAEIIIAKQRVGPVGTVNLVFDEQYTRFLPMYRGSYQ